MEKKEIEIYIRDFLEGRIDIVSFKKMCETNDEIYNFLQSIIEELKHNPKAVKKHQNCANVVEYLLHPENDPSLKYGSPNRYENVKQCLNFEWRCFTHDIYTSSGALNFFNEVNDIFYQLEQDYNPTDYYKNEFSFMIEVIPEYLYGTPEHYIEKNIISKYPSSIKKTQRKKLIRDEIKKHFKSEKGYPVWYQSSEWPLGKNGEPATYLGKDKRNSNSDRGVWMFRDDSDGEIIFLEQYS